MDCLHPLSTEQPVPEPSQETSSGWGFYIIADLKTWADNAEDRSPLEHFSSFEEAKARFAELRGESYNSEAVEPDPDGRSPARLTLGLESADGMSSIDILHVRQGQNYLVDDFTREVRLWEAASLLKILSQVYKEIGFDRIRPYECVDNKWQALPDIPFEEWDNPYFSSGTPGSIAAQYCDFLHECHPLEKEDTSRREQIAEVVQFLQREGKSGAKQMMRDVTVMMAAREGIPEMAQRLAAPLLKELAAYMGPGQISKKRHKKSPER